MDTLAVTGLSKRFGSASSPWAVREASFSLSAGEIFGLLGPNGAGKTTTIRMIISVLAPDAGSIHIFGKNLADHRSAVLQQVAFASTYTNLPLFLSVWENLDIHGRLYSMPRQERLRKIEEVLERFSIAAQRRQRVGQLSAGQRTRVMLAKAFLPSPKLVILDEPTASLDPDIAVEVRRFVRDERQQHGTTVLFSSHNMAEVTELCDRVAFMKEGRIIAVDSPRQLAASIGGSIVEFEVRSGLDAVREYLKSHDIRFELKGSHVSLTVKPSEEIELLTALRERGLHVVGLSIHPPTLEDYFLLHARPAVREASPC